MSFFTTGLLAAVVISLAGAVPAQALTVDFAVIGVGSTPSYTGPDLRRSTSFDFGGGLYLVGEKGAGDQSGLALGESVLLPSRVVYGSGFSGPITGFTKSWTDSLGTFTEKLTSFTTARATDDAITLTFLGTLIGPDVSGPAILILTASQSGGNPNAIVWGITDTSLFNPPPPTPLPGSLVLFGSVLAGLGMFIRRRDRQGA
jgi:hypothetical protein